MTGDAGVKKGNTWKVQSLTPMIYDIGGNANNKGGLLSVANSVSKRRQ